MLANSNRNLKPASFFDDAGFGWLFFRKKKTGSYLDLPLQDAIMSNESGWMGFPKLNILVVTRIPILGPAWHDLGHHRMTPSWIPWHILTWRSRERDGRELGCMQTHFRVDILVKICLKKHEETNITLIHHVDVVELPQKVRAFRWFLHQTYQSFQILKTTHCSCAWPWPWLLGKIFPLSRLMLETPYFIGAVEAVESGTAMPVVQATHNDPKRRVHPPPSSLSGNPQWLYNVNVC